MAINAQGLIKSYRGRTVVDGVSLTVDKGEVVGLLGPNGAGKTTTFYMIVGLVKAEAGAVSVDGHDVSHMPIHQRANYGLGYLPQEPSIFRRMSVQDNIMAVLEMKGLPKDKRHERLEELLRDLGLGHLRNQRGSTLSGGERRRAEIARALAADPKYILLDEPFTGVDPIAVSDIQDIVYHLKEKGFGILITDHSVRETLAITDRAYIIFDGKILVSGTAEEIALDETARKFYLGDRFSM
ncbi:MAG TPA: LPS export ABC transporter ATP-binding protein [Firmicutes bacterium]|jgi:lipopolysaccharide export system ATP-binding protein|nr:LPS export ABC transporter ATP-binding protein [Bacillota bacterium]HBE05149.1 LPS export ABC transporter ATP-binding protein [Bacillota bacterium]HBG44574.1 LPS export ABC transporter ATP-binding protein [Bacillota bacterium]HBL69174.1 LPS export ABC transporter ATP-binding protein [Bacillota bacterium]HCF89580.1 LPS export ABC transporter ATP-binding protein [Bacillota bacterium]